MTLTRAQRALTVLVVAAALIGSVAYGLASQLPTPAPVARLSIVASFYPLQEFASRLVGPDVQVSVLVPPGVEPHDWEPTPGDVNRVAGADLVVYIHPQFETYVLQILNVLPSPPPFVVTSDGLDLLSLHVGGETTVDPHIWLDPILVKHQVTRIRDALIQIDADYEQEYRERADALLVDLDALDAEISEALRLCEVRTFITSHSAFAYFARRYSLTMESITVDPEVEAGPSRILELISYARANNITIIYTEPLVTPGAAEVIAEEIDGTTLPLDPAEGVSREGTSPGRSYFSIMSDNLVNLIIGLRCVA